MERSLKQLNFEVLERMSYFSVLVWGISLWNIYLNDISLVMMGRLNGRSRYKCVKSVKRLVHIEINQSILKP